MKGSFALECLDCTDSKDPECLRRKQLAKDKVKEDKLAKEATLAAGFLNKKIAEFFDTFLHEKNYSPSASSKSLDLSADDFFQKFLKDTDQTIYPLSPPDSSTFSPPHFGSP